jgi:transmembrane sensor
MNRSSAKAGIPKEIIAEASAWFAEFRSDEMDAQTRAAFSDWLLRSPEHMRAYLEIAAAWSELPDDPQQRIDVSAFLQRARESNDAVVTLSREPRALQRSSNWRSRAVGALAASVVLIAAGWMAAVWLALGPTYTTGIGERHRIRLADNSVVELSARSSIKVQFSSGARMVTLKEGQALFEVAKDKSRPFVVRSDTAAVRAVGTRFDVNRKSSGTVVTVVEGRVAVVLDSAIGRNRGLSAFDMDKKPVYLDPGEQSVVTAAQVSAPQRADVESVTGWIHDRLTFSDTPLAEVAEVFNRYSTQQLAIVDTELRVLGINGIYSTTEPRTLIDFLRAQPNLEVIEQDQRIVVSRRR